MIRINPNREERLFTIAKLVGIDPESLRTLQCCTRGVDTAEHDYVPWLDPTKLALVDNQSYHIIVAPRRYPSVSRKPISDILPKRVTD